MGWCANFAFGHQLVDTDVLFKDKGMSLWRRYVNCTRFFSITCA